jgi:hypothetical protein
MANEGAGRASDLFRWADQLAGVAAELESLEQWREMESRAVAPRVLSTLESLNRALRGPLAERFRPWQEQYLVALEGLFAAMAKRAADRTRRRTLPLHRTIDPMLPEGARALPLSQKALIVAASVPGVTTVLVGMRETRYVDDCLSALAYLGRRPLEGAARILAASAKADLP